jgi:hypothetical protein
MREIKKQNKTQNFQAQLKVKELITDRMECYSKMRLKIMKKLVSQKDWSQITK